MNETILEILTLLEKKNSYLLEYHRINSKEISLLSKGQIKNLENFYYSRELLLDAIDKVDNKFKSKNLYEKSKMNHKTKQRLSDILKLKNDMVRSILDQDVTILSLVEQLNEGKLSIAS